jgi:hypothetical protein
MMNLHYSLSAVIASSFLTMGAVHAQAIPTSKGITTEQIANDYALFYSKPNMYQLGVALGLGAASAQWVDEDVSSHYQKHQRSQRTDDWSKTAKLFGEWRYLLPLSVAATYLDTSSESSLDEWGNRTFRALVVGAPALWSAQVITGGSRPSENRKYGSEWRPFKDNNGVSGHAFVGSIPFLTLAEMNKDDPWIYYPAMAASFATPLSRLNDNQHYFSQIVLGWYFAKQATATISNSSNPTVQSHFVPYIDSGLVGVMYTKSIR